MQQFEGPRYIGKNLKTKFLQGLWGMLYGIKREQEIKLPHVQSIQILNNSEYIKKPIFYARR